MSAYCPKCGAPIQDNATKCEYCGAALAQQPQQTAQPVYQQPTYQQPIYQQPVVQQPQHPMGWFKFLINFALWAGAIINIFGAIPVLTGSRMEMLQPSNWSILCLTVCRPWI